MEIEGCQEIDLDFEAHDLVENNQFSEAMGADKEVGISLGIDENDHLPELHESTDPERNQRNGRYNLRKSLAWDSAFFTSAGVLDPEELSSMITATDKSEKTSLPGIQEEVSGSTESLSTLESDNLTLEGCEDDLFVDIRASIQRSSKKASNLINSSSKMAAAEIESTAISSLKKEAIVSEDKYPKPGLKKTGGLLTGRISKPQPKQIAKLTSGKSIKQDSVRSQAASIAKTGETNSILPKLPKSISSSILPSTAAAKRDSMGTARVKSECGNPRLGTVYSKGTQPSKVSVLSGSRKLLPKPAVSSKSSLLGSSTTGSVQSIRSSTSSDSSVNTSSGIPAKPKSTLMTARRNPGKSSNNNFGPSGSIPKTPSRAAPKHKLPASNLSAYLTSAKISSSVSPASSISEWSSASSSSSMVNQRCNNSRTSLDTSSCKSMDGDNILLDQRNHENRGFISTNNTSKKSSTQAGTLQAPGKPSGLRLPSPKIGFFDGVKSPARTPNGHKQSESGLHTAYSKNGDSTSIPIRSSNSKLKSAKVPTSRMMTSSSSIKSASPNALSPESIPEKSHASKASGISTDLNTSLGVEGSGTGENCPKAEKVEAKDGVKLVAGAGGAGTDAIDKENLDYSNMDGNVGPGDFKTLSDEDVLIKQDHFKKDSETHAIDKVNLDYSSMDRNVGPVDIKTVPDEDVLMNQDHLKKNFDSYAIDREHLDDLSMDRNVGPGDIKAVSDEDVLINQDHLKKNSDSHAIDKGNSDDLSMYKHVASGDIKTVSVEDVLINQDHLKKDSDSHASDNEHLDCSSMDRNMGPGDIKTVSDEDMLINQDHLKKNSDSNAPDKENLDDSSMDRNVCPGDIQAVSDEDVLINQDHLKKNSDSNSPDKENLDDSSMDRNVCPGDIKAVSDEDVLINQDHLKKNSDSHVIDKGDLDDSSMYRNVGPGDIKTVSDEDVLINQDHLKKNSDSHAIDKENSDDLSIYKNVASGDIKTISDEGGLINQDDLKKNCDSHAICEAFEKQNDGKRDVFQNVNKFTCELKVDTSECGLSFPAAASKSAACRAPFTLKNTSESNECLDTNKELVIQVGVADKTGYVLPSSEQKENI